MHSGSVSLTDSKRNRLKEKMFILAHNFCSQCHLTSCVKTEQHFGRTECWGVECSLLSEAEDYRIPLSQKVRGFSGRLMNCLNIK